MIRKVRRIKNVIVKYNINKAKGGDDFGSKIKS